MSSSKITLKGQVTIPKEVRDTLGLSVGDQVLFVAEGDRALMVPIRTRSLEQLRGVARRRVPFSSREAEREAARQKATQHISRLQNSDANSQN